MIQVTVICLHCGEKRTENAFCDAHLDVTNRTCTRWMTTREKYCDGPLTIKEKVEN